MFPSQSGSSGAPSAFGPVKPGIARPTPIRPTYNPLDDLIGGVEALLAAAEMTKAPVVEIPQVTPKIEENQEENVKHGRVTRLSSQPEGTQGRKSKLKKVLHWDAESEELDGLDEQSSDGDGDLDDEERGNRSPESGNSSDEDGEPSSEEWGTSKRKRGPAPRSKPKSNANIDVGEDPSKNSKKKSTVKRKSKKGGENDSESGSVKTKDSRVKKKESDATDGLDADDAGEWDDAPTGGPESMTETISPWDQLQAPLPLASLPTLSHCDITDTKMTHFLTLVQLDSTAPSIEPIDSLSIWRKSTITRPPFALQSAPTAAPTSSLVHPSALSTATTKTQRKTTPFMAPPPSLVISRGASTGDASANSQASKNKKKRKRLSAEDEEGGGGGDDDAQQNDDVLDFSPLAATEQTKSSRKQNKKPSKVIQPLDIDTELDAQLEASTRKKAKLAEESSGRQSPLTGSAAGDLETPGRGGSGSGNPSAAKRRMSKGDEFVVVRRDAEGKVVMPLTFGAIVVESLGVVDYQNDKFHSKRYIFPVGYISKRLYFSLKRPDQRCTYTQEIVASPNDPKEPLFRLICEDDPSSPIEGPTPSGVWTEVLERVRPFREAAAGRKLFSTVSGPEQFGLSHGVIHKLIGELPNANKCANYDSSLIDTKQTKSKKEKE